MTCRRTLALGTVLWLLAGCASSTPSRSPWASATAPAPTASATAAPVAAPPWPLYRGDSRRDGDPGTTRVVGGRLSLAWRRDLGSWVTGSPVIAAGSIYVGTDAGVLADLDLASGRVEWRVSGLGALAATPAVAGGRLLVGALNGHVYAFSAASGRRLWTWTAGGSAPQVWSSPIVAGNLVIVGIASPLGDAPLQPGRLVALDLSTGAMRWTACARPGCTPGDGIWSSPAVDGQGRVFVGYGNPDDGVLAVAATTGRRLWTRSLYADAGRDVDVGATPLVLGSRPAEEVAVGGDDGSFHVLRAGDGTTVWSRQVETGAAGAGLLASPASDGAVVYQGMAGPGAFGVTALAVDSGASRWRTSTPLPVYSGGALAGGHLFIGEGAAFGSDTGGGLLSLAIGDGRVTSAYSVGSAVTDSPALGAGMLVAGDRAGSLLAFRVTK